MGPFPLRRFRALAGLILSALALTVAGCASSPETPAAMVDPQANFDEYETFGWHDEPGTGSGSAPMSLADTHIRTAIKTAMQGKGYVPAPPGTTPDLLIDYQVAHSEKIKTSPFRIGIGVGSYGSGGGASVGTSTSGVRNVSEASLVVHAIDTARNAEVWRSRVSRELGKDEVKAEDVQRAVSEIFSDFPAHSAGP
mgnify:CR=1 FL=1